MALTDMGFVCDGCETEVVLGVPGETDGDLTYCGETCMTIRKERND